MLSLFIKSTLPWYRMFLNFNINLGHEILAFSRISLNISQGEMTK